MSRYSGNSSNQPNNRGNISAPDSNPGTSGLFSRLRNSSLGWLKRACELPDADNGANYQGEVDQPMTVGRAGRITLLSTLGLSYLQQFGRSGAISDIDNAVSCQLQAVQLTSDSQIIIKPRLLSILGDIYMNRFDCLGELSDINNAIAYLSQAVQLAPNTRADKPGWLNQLGVSYVQRFERLGELSDIDNAVAYLSQAVQLAPDISADKPMWLNQLGISYIRRFERLGAPSDLDNAVSCQNLATQLTPGGHATKSLRVNNLGTSYLYRFERLGKLEDLDQAVYYQSQAVQIAPDDHKDKPRWLTNLGLSYMRRFKHLGELLDVDKAIEFQSRALQLASEDDLEKPTLLNNLGTSYLSRFEHTGKLEDVDLAIRYQSQAVEVSPDGHKGTPARLNNLGLSYMRRFERLGELSDVDKAITCQGQAVQLSPDDHTEKPIWLGNLGNSYLRRFERFGELDDVDMAIYFQKQVVELAPDGHAEKPTWINNIGLSYARRFERLGELSDIDESVAFHSQAVQITPDGQAVKPLLLSNLGSSYLRRFLRFGEVSDVDKAVYYHNQAVEITPDGHKDKPSWLNNLTSSYTFRFERFRERQDIDNAVACQSQALQLTPDDHVIRPTLLSNLGGSYLRRFEILGGLSDVEQAIFHQSQAVQLCPDDHKDKPTWLSNLALSCMRRFDSLGELSDINKAITHGGQALAHIPDGHSDEPLLLNNLGESYMRLFEHQGRLSDAEAAGALFQRSAELAIVKPQIQFRSARQWAGCSLVLGNSPQPAYRRSMELIPRLIWLGNTINQRYNILSEIGDFAVEAAAWATSTQAFELAVEWLEEGRSIVWNQILQLRTPFDRLAAADPLLAHDLKQVGRDLEHAGSQSATLPSHGYELPDLEWSAQNHRRLAIRWEQLLNRARQIPGFENFMCPRKVMELKMAATDGPVVLINAHSVRCDALILLPWDGGIAHVPLKNFSLKKAADICALLKYLVGQGDGRAGGFKRRSRPAPKPEDQFRSVLATLWLDAVGPVLDFLGYTNPLPIDELPHVTWCTTGALSFLPLHAAGLYDGSQPNAFDLVVSSYVPTINALLASRVPTSNLCSGVLAVGQEHTRGFSSLPSTVKELAAIKMHAKDIQYSQLDGDNATVDTVLNAMEQHSWVHLACHATQDPVDPANSAFHLHNDKLTLEQITKRSFKNKGLAFLSACQTATGDDKLPDEAIHLAAGMQMAGYPTVIATMWSVFDVDGPEIAERMYAELLKDGKMDCTGAARALHKAVADLREKIGADSFRRWVPFIHIGA